jgi:Ni/Co efflux regulator RcnB
MRIIRSIATALLALPIVLAASAGEAQQSQQGQQRKNVKQVNQKQAADIEARHQCFLEAQARHPGYNTSDPGLQSERTNAYISCAARKGIRP